MMRRVVSVWLPLLATEALRRPGAPPAEKLATATDGGNRHIVAVGRAARASGVRPGMSVADALAVAPDLVLAAHRPEAERDLLARLADWCSRYTPLVAVDEWSEGAEGGGLWLDTTGCDHLFANAQTMQPPCATGPSGEAAMLADLTHCLGRLGFTAGAAIAGTPGAAWAWARFGSRTAPILAPGRPREELAALPVAALRLEPGVDTGLCGLGLDTIGTLYGVPRATLTARFGPSVARRLDQAMGDLAEPISPRKPPPSHRIHASFAEPIGHTEGVLAATHRLVTRLCGQLERESLGLRRLEVAAFRVDTSVRTVLVGTGRASRDPTHLMRLLKEKLSEIDTGFGIEMLRVSALETAPLQAEQTGLARPAPPDALARLVDGLANRLGADRVVRLAPRHSHIPERAVQTIPLGAPMPRSGSWPAGRRPVRLFPWPEPVEAMAPVPDAPPVQFRWHGRTHRVVRADGPERVAAEWWRCDAPTRDYYCVEDDAGHRFWLYREGLYGADPIPRWFVHGVFA